MQKGQDRGAGSFRAGARDDRGATMVEFAIVLPLILLLLFGIIEYGIAFNADSNVNQSARAGGRSAAILSADPQMEFKAAEAAAAALNITPGSISQNPQVCVGPVVGGTDIDPCNDPRAETFTLVHLGTPGAPLWAISGPGINPGTNTYPANDNWPVATRNFGCPKNGQPGTFDQVVVRVVIKHKLLVPGLFAVFFGNTNTPTLSSSSVFQLEPVSATSCS